MIKEKVKITNLSKHHIIFASSPNEAGEFDKYWQLGPLKTEEFYVDEVDMAKVKDHLDAEKFVVDYIPAVVELAPETEVSRFELMEI